MKVCTICDEVIEPGQRYVRVRVDGALPDDPPAYVHRACRKRPAVVPFIAKWSGETSEEPLVMLRLLGGIGYAGETTSDRDDRGVLWLRSVNSPRVGLPRYGEVHSGRQQLAMRRLLCQVCGEPADQDDRGVLWLLEDRRSDWAGWPDGLVTTHPPICVPCLGAAREQCPHLWAGSVAVRVGRSEVCGVYGRRYATTKLGPMPVEADVVMFESPLVRWVIASQLVRALYECSIVSLDEVLAAHA